MPDPCALLVPFILLLQVDIGRVLKIGSIFYYVFKFKGPLESHVLALVLSLVGLGYFSWGVVNFIVSYRQTKIARRRLQILYLLVGIISMFVIGLVLHVANYLFDLGYSFFFVASLYSLLISFFFALAIVRYRLVDIHFIIRGGILYSLLSGLVLVIYVLFIKNVCDILAKKFETTSLLLESSFVLVLVFLLRPLERKVEEFIDRFFYRERYQFRLKFFEFTRTLANLLDLPALLEAAVNFISQALARRIRWGSGSWRPRRMLTGFGARRGCPGKSLFPGKARWSGICKYPNGPSSWSMSRTSASSSRKSGKSSRATPPWSFRCRGKRVCSGLSSSGENGAAKILP